MPTEWKNKLYFGDNLPLLRDEIPSESVDLIYLDPPFNSKASYNILFKERSGEQSAAQIVAFEDTWHWGKEAELAFHEIVTKGPKKTADLMQAFRSFLGQNDMMAYITMMAPRIVEMHNVLKPTGSIYLHCDPTASHYLKLVMDAVFGPIRFRNEITWRRTGSHNKLKRYGPVHDTILFYTKTDDYIWNGPKRPYMRGHVEENFVLDEHGYRTNYYGNVLTVRASVVANQASPGGVLIRVQKVGIGRFLEPWWMISTRIYLI
jgi:site-specific DNA-methyltransferase (adenine-specific)